MLHLENRLHLLQAAQPKPCSAVRADAHIGSQESPFLQSTKFMQLIQLLCV